MESEIGFTKYHSVENEIAASLGTGTVPSCPHGPLCIEFELVMWV